jgi:hypothetical protein
MKVENMLRIIIYIFGYLLCDDMFEKICQKCSNSKYGETRAPFSHKNHLHVLKSYFFQLETIKKFAPQKQNTDVILRAELPGCLALDLKVL